jgi:pantoate--beta-alanine ligase
MRHLTTFDHSIDSLAFVPTMGALHDGHRSLITRARGYGKKVLVSVYVNPTQFESADDLAKYPKTLDNDLAVAKEAGADYLWTPSVTEIYPEGLADVHLISAGPIGDMYEGASRPNHFSGVLTVINRLFSITKPEFAIFGEKDFQQLFLIRKFAGEHFPQVSIIAGETIRDKDGVALSSRNKRLSDDEMKIAQILPKVQRAVKGLHESTSTEIAAKAREVFATEEGFTVDYVAIVNPETLLPVGDDFQGRVQILLAGWIGSVRLIDNFSHEVKGRR